MTEITLTIDIQDKNTPLTTAIARVFYKLNKKWGEKMLISRIRYRVGGEGIDWTKWDKFQL